MVNYDLDRLKIGENRVVVGRRGGFDLHDRDIAPGDGWSRALYAPECTWPQGAHLCVLVEWHPDRRGGSDWAARLEAVTSGLRALDYVVERAGQPIDPANDLHATLLVYRMEADRTPPRRPDDAWAHVPAPRTYTWQETNPLERMEWRLKQTKAARNGARVMVRDVASALWPPEADLCGLARWWPSSHTSTKAVYDGLREMASVMQDAGYQVRTQERPLPDTVESVDLLVYREATERKRIAIRDPGTSRRRPSWTRRDEDLERIAALLRAGLPVDKAFDDVATVVGDGSTPDEETIPALIERFRGTATSPGHLAVLVDAVEREQSGNDPRERERRISRARQVGAQPVSGAAGASLGYLRRLASAAEDLLEILLPDDEAEAGPCLL
ncbi:DUF6415 family natural product biosynthesis protein [Streptomyces mutabilis]|uniref:DUF6415 family natural product biosynthesis protein n=1 Tax=Streptomyces mutabilis TaxID=67332 RepID=UPI000A2216EF|nr:hypothetical protein B5181_11240 [Streptomyces sp. 4F]